MQTTASQNVLIFLFGLVDLLASGVNVDGSTSFSVLKVSLPHRSRGTIAFHVCAKNGIKKNCFQRILRVESFFPPKGWVIGWVNEKSPLDLLKFLQPKCYHIPKFQRQTFNPKIKLRYKFVGKICLPKQMTSSKQRVN